MTKATISTPFPSLEETADKYGLSPRERLEVQRAIDEIFSRAHSKRTPTRRGRALRAAAKKK
jgi:hypothetical protein